MSESEFDDENAFSKMCRLCLSQNQELLRLYPKDEFNSTMSGIKIVEIIERFTTVKIHPWDKLPQKICESCIQTIKSMLAFQNKCKRNNDELLRRITGRDESKSAIQLLDEGDTKPIFESVDVDESDSKAAIFNVPDTDTKETFTVLHSDDSDSRAIFEVTDMVDSDSKDGVNASESDRKEILMVNIIDRRHSSESDDGYDNKNSIGHIQSRVNDKRSTNRYPKSGLGGTLACHICGKRYHNYKMKYHINMHEGRRPFACNIDNCTSTFAAPYELKTHKRECHFRKAEWVCDVCGRGFKRKPALRVHLSYHFDPKIPCTICEKLFKNNRALTKHMLVHSQERKFKCETCGKSFQTRYTLRIHKRVHTQEKPYSCQCGMSFAYKCLLKAHTEKYHQGQGAQSS